MRLYLKALSLAVLPAICAAGPTGNYATPSSIVAESFIENKGQWPAEVLYATRRSGADVWITRSGAVYDFYQSSAEAGHHSVPPHLRPGGRPEHSRRGQVVQMELRNSTFTGEVSIPAPLPGVYNYLIGSNTASWTRSVHAFPEVSLHNVWYGIDARYYSDGNAVRYDFILHPGASLDSVRMDFRGAEKVAIDRQTGELVMQTLFGEVRQSRPVAYLLGADGAHTPVACAFTQEPDGSIGFNADWHDRTRTLVIDPLVYSTYLGGGGYDVASDITSDAIGAVYVVGYTASLDYPTTPGAYDQTQAGPTASLGDFFVTKLSATGAMVYSTFVGGSEEEYFGAITVDAAGAVTFAGVTESNNAAPAPYPFTAGSYVDSIPNGYYGTVVTRLNPAGSDIVWATFVAPVAFPYDMAQDAAGDLYITGTVQTSFFPATPGAYDTSYNGGGTGAFVLGDGFVAKLSTFGDSLLYGTFLGGSLDGDRPLGIAVNTAGEAFVTGFTEASNFPTTPGAYRTAIGGSAESGFLTKLNASGSALLYSTFIYQATSGSGIAVDNTGAAYLSGYVHISTFPATAGAFDVTYNDNGDAFVLKMNPAGSSLVYATYLGTGAGFSSYGQDVAEEIRIDAAGAAYVTGTTTYSGFPTTPGAFDASYAVSGSATSITADGFVSKLSPSGGSLLYSTYFGGVGGEGPSSLTLLPGGTVAVSGTTTSTDYPTSTGSYDPTFNGYYDAFVFALNVCPANLSNTTSNSPACEGGSILLSANGGTTYAWTGPAGFISTASAPTLPATATAAGTYTVTVTFGACVETDTINVLVEAVPAPAITNTGGVLSTASGFATYQWFLDGTSIAGATAATYTPTAIGVYTVTVTSAAGCTGTSAPFTLTSITSIAGPGVAAGLRVYPNPAAGYVVVQASVPVTAVLRDATGRTTVLRKDGGQRISLTGVVPGVYALEVWHSATASLLHRQKLVVKAP